jgi:hypothetical protein
MKISATYNQQLTEKIHVVMVRKLLILRSAKSISDRLLVNLPRRHSHRAQLLSGRHAGLTVLNHLAGELTNGLFQAVGK